jgi:hypothetical protein
MFVLVIVLAQGFLEAPRLKVLLVGSGPPRLVHWRSVLVLSLSLAMRGLFSLVFRFNFWRAFSGSLFCLMTLTLDFGFVASAYVASAAGIPPMVVCPV